MTQGLLRGMGIVVTRPAHQADKLCQLIRAQGGDVIRFPTLEIRPPRNAAALQAVIDRLEQYHLAIFTSANAVAWGLKAIHAKRRLPAELNLAAIGNATAQALIERGAPPQLRPQSGFDSEALLALPALQRVAGRRILIVRGEGGRDLLREVLTARGAQVDYAETYCRAKPDVRPDALLERWARGKIHAVVITSNESLRNLFDIVGEVGRQWLYKTAWVAVSVRAVRLARELGFEQPLVIAREVSDEAIVEALLSLAPNPVDKDF